MWAYTMKMQGSINPWKAYGLTQMWYIFNFITEQTKLQCVCSVEPKDASGTSKIKVK